MMSPRTKAVSRSSYASSELAIFTSFLKTQLKLLLKLVSSDINKAEDAQLNAKEFNILRILLKPVAVDSKKHPLFDKPLPDKPLSAFAPFFPPHKETKVSIELVADWLMGKIFSSEVSGQDSLMIK